MKIANLMAQGGQPDSHAPRKKTEVRELSEIDQAIEGLRHYPRLYDGSIPREFYLNLIIPLQPDITFNLGIAAWLEMCNLETLLTLWREGVAWRWEAPTTRDNAETGLVMQDRNMYGVALDVFTRSMTYPEHVAKEVYQECLSLLNIILFSSLRMSDVPRSRWRHRHSYYSFLSTLHIYKQHGVSAELYEQSLAERTHAIYNVMGVPGLERLIQGWEGPLWGYMQTIRRYYNRNPRRLSEVPLSYEAMVLFCTMLFVMQRDRLTRILPDLGHMVDDEHRVWPKPSRTTSLKAMAAKLRKEKPN